ncbi:MAG: efflux RND transporter periplasmic adaptor subunit [Massilibacteroides sp.]|nr:efflux RND transporter periplasmic adaptor subunit [Massilibacteroides sp.]MDD3062186.1 efflux RND transporter periplasmic adaptor subunit [Massilibacteroides sp.]MDD4116291.1 efflux RND transporter periplasmic adaptor subunit [Massilibacteroides sp.]MDD4659704.1 efflux RND transporter periplasmic adaptor subunit [Massilibacteroides sp.]
MIKKVKWGVTLLIVLLILGMIIYPKAKRMLTAPKGGFESPAPSGTPRNKILNINAEIIRSQPLSDKIVSAGSVIPDEEVDLSFESSGKVVAIYFTEGTHVKKGELLAKINDSPLQAQLKKLEAQIPLAKDRVYRQRALLAKDAVSQEAFEQVQTELEKLMADIDLVKANITLTELRAPFDGIIGLRNVSEGSYTTPSTIVAKLTKISPLKIDFSIPERYSGEVKFGTRISFSLESNDGIVQKHQATVYAVESKIDMDTRTLNVRATYPNERETILPGRLTWIEITKQEIQDALTVPSEAIIPEMGKNIVYKYQNGVAEPIEIKTGIRTESRVQAINGLSPGDTIITSGVMQLRKGMNVSIDNLY